MSTVAEVVRPEDVLPVRSRVSWGPIIAGAFVALALYLLLNLLGAALGLSLSNRLRGDQLTTSAAVWAIVVTLVSLFVGGWVTTQCTAGETGTEAFLYGVVLWGVVFTALLALTASRVRLGFDAMMGIETGQYPSAYFHSGLSKADLDHAAQQAGLTQDQANKVWSAIPTTPDQMRQAAEDPHTREAAMRTAWWAFGGTLISMLTAVLSAMAGAGPTPVFMRRILVNQHRATVAIR